jgi:small subunit ribosomal protein S4
MRQGDVISLRPKAQKMIVIRHNIDTLDRQVPQWLEVSTNDTTATVRDLPLREQIDVPVREQLIVELYSK